jgi:predicted nucleotidyltransferase
MNLINLRDRQLKEVFDALEEAFTALDIDYYLIGALARDVWYTKEGKKFRTTKDADFAVLAGSHTQYEEVKDYLKKYKNFQDSKGNAFVLLAPGGIQVDILPFGQVAIDEGVKVAGNGLSTIKVNGFMEVYQQGTEQVKVETGHSFKIATLPAIVLLKLIAYDDRPEKRLKDARDIANIMTHYFDLQADLIYEGHNDLFAVEERTLEEIAAIVIGREVKNIAVGNTPLLTRLKRILANEIDRKEGSPFVREITAELASTVEQTTGLLENLLSGLEGK